MNRVSVSALVLSVALLAGCAAKPDEGAVTGDEANLTQSRVSALSDAKADAVRRAFGSALEGSPSGLYGQAAAFRWGSTKLVDGVELTGAQLGFLATELLEKSEIEDALPEADELDAVDVEGAAGLGAALRLEGASATTVERALGEAKGAGLRVARLAPKEGAAPGEPTAGALVVVDMKHREALVLYGRRGPAPARVDCTITEMHSYEFEEGVSKVEYPSVDAAEVAMTGDVALELGVLSTFSNAAAAREGEDYAVTLTRSGSQLVFEAKGPSWFLAKLVVDGTTGTVYGDRDGNGRPNKAATVTCKSATTATAK